jgi:hypothetical protein
MKLQGIFEELKQAASDLGTTRRDGELLNLAEIAAALGAHQTRSIHDDTTAHIR